MTRLAAPRRSPAGLLAIALLLGTFVPVYLSSLVSSTPSAEAGPVIQVRARTAIAVEPIRRARGADGQPQFLGLRIRGRIHERGSDEPVPFATGVTLWLDDKTRTVIVNEDGWFEASFTTVGGRHRLFIQYPGDARFEGSSFSLPELDVAKQPLVLSLRVPDQVRRSRGPLEIEVQASDEIEPAQVRVSIQVGPAEKDELPIVAHVTTGELGRAPVLIPVAQLGVPGQKRIKAEFAGDDAYDPASVEATFLLSSQTRVEFKMADTDVRFEGRVRGSGRLVDDLGAGLAGQSISLVADVQGGRRKIDESLTGPDGRFSLDAPASELGPGKHMAQAAFESPRAFLESSRSAPARITVAERRPVPVAYSLAAFAATAATIIAFVALRTRPWTGWVKRLRGESARPGAPTSAEKRDLPPHTGLTLARPGLVSTLRRPHDRGFTGVVADAIVGHPIAEARVELSGGDGPGASAVTDAAGRFAFEDLAEGVGHATVSAPGYVTERFELGIPHRGELRDTRVDLLPVRERIFQLYREVAESLLPRPELWGVWTPRQIFDHVRGRRPAKALAHLTDYVEEKYFSARVPEEAELARAETTAAAARAEAGSFGGP